MQGTEPACRGVASISLNLVEIHEPVSTELVRRGFKTVGELLAKAGQEHKQLCLRHGNRNISKALTEDTKKFLQEYFKTAPGVNASGRGSAGAESFKHPASVMALLMAFVSLGLRVGKESHHEDQMMKL